MLTMGIPILHWNKACKLVESEFICDAFHCQENFDSMVLTRSITGG